MIKHSMDKKGGKKPKIHYNLPLETTFKPELKLPYRYSESFFNSCWSLTLVERQSHIQSGFTCILVDFLKLCKPRTIYKLPMVFTVVRFHCITDSIK